MVRKIILTSVISALAVAGFAQKKPMNEFVDDLMAKMTLQEKIGQLNLMVAGDITTGGAMDTQVGGDIARGNMGGIFNIKGIDKIKALQEIAVKKSRLGIPLIVGMDVIHGYETIFPIPLALSCSWDMAAVEQSAHIAAKEASADGINLTFSPMVDMDLNGTVDRNWNLDMVASVHEINMERFANKFPYPVSGKGTFAGEIGGTLMAPTFHGILTSPSITLNDQTITDIRGMVDYEDSVVSVSQFGFRQGGGSYQAALSINVDTHDADGTIKVQDGDINAITAIGNFKNDIVTGKLSSDIQVGGTYDNPELTVIGRLDAGKISGYDVHDVDINLHLLDHVIYIDKLMGQQGTDGSFEAGGTVTIGGPIAAHFSAQKLALGIGDTLTYGIGHLEL